MSTKTAEDTHYQLEEGYLCVDFVNTAYILADEAAPFGYQNTEEQLIDLPALGAWAEGVGLLEPAEVDLLREDGPPAATRRLEDLRALREALRRIIRAHARAQPTPESSLAVLNRTIPPVLSRTRLAPDEVGFAMRMADDEATTATQVIDQILWAVGQSAISLLTSAPELETISECPAEDCGYLFRDTSHGRRRWCSMKSCGNRAKVQRFRDRHKLSA
jgi:predicted RNA-binding Zn ribbon-like protein